MRWLLAIAFLIRLPLAAGTAADVARAIREVSFDRDECYRVRDVTLVKEDVRIYFTDGHLIFSKPVMGRRIAAVFTSDTDGGDGEIILLPPNRAERSSLARFTGSPNLDEHFRTALFLFTGGEYEALMAQLPDNPANKRVPELGAVMDEEWASVLHNLGESYQTRLTLDLLNGPGHPRGLFAALFRSARFGPFDLIFDPLSYEQIMLGQLNTRQNRLFFDTWTSFPARSSREHPAPPPSTVEVRDYRIEATVNPDLSLSVLTRVRLKPLQDGMVSAAVDLTADMEVTDATVDGHPAEMLQRESLRLNLTRGGNNLFLVVPAEPLRAGREYEFAFHHHGKVIHDAGDRVFYISSRGTWYPMPVIQFADYDLLFRYPKDLDLVSAGDVVEDRTEGEWRITHWRTPAPIRMAAFNLGNYAHARLERGGYVVDVCANRTLEAALRPRIPVPPLELPPATRRRADSLSEAAPPQPPPDPLERLHTLAEEVASSLEFMVSKYGPPALPHLTVSPIPGTFGQGFPGMVYLSTLSYIKNLPHAAAPSATQELFYADLLQAHETAHQWWGNRVSAVTYRDYWLMEAMANYSALLYLEKSKGAHSVDLMLDFYRTGLLAKNDAGQEVDSAGPIVLGSRLENSLEPRAWRTIIYGKGTWIIQMLRRRMGDEPFFAMLAQILKVYDRKEISTEDFRNMCVQFLPRGSDDPKLEAFFDQWVYGTGIPNLKLTWVLRGKAPALRLVGTLTQTEANDECSVVAPVEIQVARGRTITQWVRSGSTPTTFNVALKQAPLKVTLDPHYGVLRR